MEGPAYYWESPMLMYMSLIKHPNCVAQVQRIVQQENQWDIQFTKRGSPTPMFSSPGITKFQNSMTDENNNLDEDDSMPALANNDGINHNPCQMAARALSSHAGTDDSLKYPTWTPLLQTPLSSPFNSHSIPDLQLPTTIPAKVQPNPD